MHQDCSTTLSYLDTPEKRDHSGGKFGPPTRREWGVTVIGYHLEPLFSFNASLDMDVIGLVAEGVRINFRVTSGEISGPKLRGKLRPTGGDWLTRRTDGVADLDVRVTLESEDGGLIYAR